VVVLGACGIMCHGADVDPCGIFCHDAAAVVLWGPCPWLP
jgi:hypothetical protein